MKSGIKCVRESTDCGPCISLGMLVRETARFFVYYEWLGGKRYSGRERRISKTGRAHVDPCPACEDHPESLYRNWCGN